MLIIGVWVGNFLPAVLTVDKVIYHARLQRSRTKQGYQCNNVFKTVRLKTFNQFFHTAGFKLEYRSGFGRL